MWFTGIDVTEIKNARSKSEYLKILIPFTLTFVFIFLGLLVVTLILFTRRDLFIKFFPAYAIIFFWGSGHILFSIQARYTVPVHLLLLMLIACILTELFHKNSLTNKS